MNFYEYLGVSQNASDEEIHKAFRLLAKEKHPDHNKKESAFWDMVELNVIRDTLLNKHKRAHYDESLKKGTKHDTPPSGNSAHKKKTTKSGIYQSVKSFFTYRCITCGTELSSTWKGYCLLHYLEATGQINNPDFIFEYGGQQYKWAEPPDYVRQHQKKQHPPHSHYTTIIVSAWQISVYTICIIGISILIVLMSLHIGQ